MKPQQWMACGAVLAALAVVTGAFGAHGLQDRLKASGRFEANVMPENGLSPELALDRALDNYKTAAHYQMIHALGLLVAGSAGLHRRSRWLDVAGWCFVMGIGFFSGSLYGLVLTGYGKLGMVAPVGGVAFICGWLALAGGVGFGKAQTVAPE